MVAALILAAALAGPVRAEVVRVVDGDTVEVDARPWPHFTVRVLVRLRGVDTPEKAPRAKCAGEAEAAAKASAFTAQRLPQGSVVLLSDIDDDKYGGRVVAAIEGPGGSLAAALIEAGLARPYRGGTKATWCQLEGGQP